MIHKYEEFTKDNINISTTKQDVSALYKWNGNKLNQLQGTMFVYVYDTIASVYPNFKNSQRGYLNRQSKRKKNSHLFQLQEST